MNYWIFQCNPTMFDPLDDWELGRDSPRHPVGVG
jgi:hypothetical protein